MRKVIQVESRLFWIDDALLAIKITSSNILQLLRLYFTSIRFSYTYYDKKHGPIYKSIEALDRMGMEIIETGDADSFKRYLQQYENTICGRHPISVFLNVSYFSLVPFFIYIFIRLNLCSSACEHIQVLNSCPCQKGRITLSLGWYDHS